MYELGKLKLKLYEAELNDMLHCIKIFTNTCAVTMQVKRVIGKAILHKWPIYMTDIGLYVLVLSLHLFVFQL